MSHPRTSILLIAGTLAVLAALPAGALAQSDEPGTPCGRAFAEVVSPSDGAKVPQEGIDPPCDKPGYCIWINVQGRIGNCYWPFIGIMPRETKPLFWIQPRIQHVDRATGRFSLAVRLGSGRDGLDEEFEIFVIGHRQQNRFYDDQTLFGLPEECQTTVAKDTSPPCIASSVVTVRRVR
jgi:hypothetical protein